MLTRMFHMLSAHDILSLSFICFHSHRPVHGSDTCHIRYGLLTFEECFRFLRDDIGDLIITGCTGRFSHTDQLLQNIDFFLGRSVIGVLPVSVTDAGSTVLRNRIPVLIQDLLTVVIYVTFSAFSTISSSADFLAGSP